MRRKDTNIQSPHKDFGKYTEKVKFGKMCRQQQRACMHTCARTHVHISLAPPSSARLCTGPPYWPQ